MIVSNTENALIDTGVLATSRPVTRRPSTDADLAFLHAVYASTRAAELAVLDWSDEQKQDFLKMQFHAQHTFYHQNFPDAQYDVLEQDGVPIGRIYVDNRASEVRLMDIALLPQFQSQGIGSSLIKGLMKDAAATGLPITLHVEVFNRAQQLYLRLGFRRVQDDGLYILMEWKPEGSSS